MDEAMDVMRLRYTCACHVNNVDSSHMANALQSISSDTTEMPSGNLVYVRVRNGANDGNGTVYACPTRIVQAGSTLLRSVLVDHAAQDTVEGTINESGNPVNGGDTDDNDDDKMDSRWSGKHLATREDPYPMPYTTSDLIEIVALYWEHFYGEAPDVAAAPEKTIRDATNDIDEETKMRVKVHSHGLTAQQTRLNDALHASGTYPYYRALYCLSAWEQQFVLEKLLQLPALLQRRQRRGSDDVRTQISCWMASGAWVDALGMPCGKKSNGKSSSDDVCRVKPNTWTTPSLPEQTSSACEFASGSSTVYTRKEVYLTDAEKYRIIPHLMNVLASATQLGVPSLQCLCAACIAHMLANRSEADILTSLLGTEAAPLPPFSSRTKAELQKEFSWAPLTAANSDYTVDTLLQPDVEGEIFYEVGLP